MDVNAGSSGNATLQQEDDTESNIATQSNSVTPPEHSYSITARWRQRAADYEDLKHSTIPQWCQQDSPAIEDLKLPAPHPEAPCCTSMCKAIAVLNESCETFVKRKKDYPAEYAEAQKELAKAQKDLVEAKKVLAKTEKEPVEPSKHVVMPSGTSTTHNDKLVVQRLTMHIAQLANLADVNGKLMNADNDLVVRKAALFVHEADMLHRSHSGVKFLLGALKAAGNTVTRETDDSRGSRKSSSSLDSGRFTREYQSSPSQYDKLCNPPALELQKADFLHRLTSEQLDLLVPFYKYLQYIFGKASRLDGNDAEYSQKIEQTVNGIMRWHIGESMESSSTKFYIPSHEGQDINGVQPILFAIMVKMAQLLGLVVPPKPQEEGIPRDENHPHRYTNNIGTSFVEEYLFTILPGMLGVPIQVKPIAQGKKKKIERLLLKAQHRVVGHLAKRALFSVDIGGLGEDYTSVGLALSMGTVTAVVLELSDVGTTDVEVIVRRTKWVPLFDQDTRKHLFGEKANHVDASIEIEEVPHGMPEGFQLLAQTLVMVHHHGFGRSLQMTRRKGSSGKFSMQPHTTELIELGTVLGSGSFSHVLKLVDKQDSADDVFIKVPQYHHLRHCLEQEAEALKDLCDNRCIPKLYDTNCPIKTLHINLRCETSAVPCLPMRGHIGRSAMQHQNWHIDKLEFLALEVYGALEYANSKGWTHLDVQPSNIVTRVDPYSGCLNVMLVDWGCARRTSVKRNGFIGCAPFSHNDLFDETMDWYPCLEHDVASLAYTLAFLSEGGIIPSWQGGFTDCRDVQDYNKEYRFETVHDILKPFFQTGSASQKFKQTLFNVIDYPGSKGGKQKKAKTSM